MHHEYQAESTRRTIVKTTAIVCFTALLIACGGGGGGGNSGDTNRPPTFSSTLAVSVPENITTNAHTIDAVDADGDPLTFSIAGGSDAGLFTLNTTSGELRFTSPPDFEQPTDANNDNRYELVIRVQDDRGGIELGELVIVVMDVAEGGSNAVPSFVSVTTVQVAENIDTVFYTANAIDTDDDPITYNLIGGADAALFQLNDTTGELSFAISPDFEAPADSNGDNRYALDIQANDNRGGLAGLELIVTVTDVVEETPNEAPVFTSAATASITENSLGVAYFASATDPDNDPLSFSLTGTDAVLFSFDAVTGELSFIVAPNFEAPADANNDNVYEVDIGARDDRGASTSLSVEFTVLDANDAPRFISAEQISVTENSTSVYSASATDEDGDTLSFSLSGGADLAHFSIDSFTGELVFNTAPDFEAPGDADNDNLYEVEISVSDDQGGSASFVLNLTVENASNEAPQFTSATQVNVFENSVAAYTASATDPDGDALIFSLSGGDDADLFSINPMTGELRFDAPPDFENPGDSNQDNIYNVVLSVEDGRGGFDTIALAVTVTNIAGNEPPTFLSAATVSVLENNSGVFYSTLTHDGDGDPVSLSMSGADAARFNLDAATGNLNFSNAPDFENPLDANLDNRYEVELRAEDGKGGVANLALSVDVENENQLMIAIFYPTPNANLAGAVDYTTVSGRLSDAEDGIVDFEDVNFIDVNGHAAIQSLDAPSRWSVRIPVPHLVNTLEASVTSSNGASHSVSQMLENHGLLWEAPVDFVLDAENNRVIMTDNQLDVLMTIDLNTGERTLVSGLNRGEGTSFSIPSAVDLDTANNRVFVTDTSQRALFAVDLTTGDRAIISAGNTGAGPAFARPVDLVTDLSNNRVLVLDNILDSVIAVDLDSGARTVISDDETGLGVAISSPWSLALDRANNRVLLADVGGNGILAVDLNTGDRTLISDRNVGLGPEFGTPIGIEVDETLQRALVIDLTLDAVFSVDLTTGDRTILSNVDTGSGIEFGNPTDLAIDRVNNKILVLDSDLLRLLSVNSVTGDRSTLLSGGVGEGISIKDPQGIVMDTENSRLLLVDDRFEAVTAVDLNSGSRTELSSNRIGTGPSITPHAIALDTANNRGLVSDSFSDSVFAFNLETGDRTLLSDFNADFGWNNVSLNSMVFNETNGSILLTDAVNDAVLVLNPASVTLSTVSDASHGNGPLLSLPVSAVLDRVGNRLLIGDPFLRALLAVDLNSGDRTILSDTNTGSGPSFLSLTSLAVDFGNNRAIVADAFFEHLVAVDLSTGNRTIIADENIGTGPVFGAFGAIVLDEENNRAFVSQARPSNSSVAQSSTGVLVVDLVTGERAVMAK